AQRAIELFARAGQATPRLEPELCLARLALHRGDDELARASFEALRLRAASLRRDDYSEHAIAGHLALARAAGDVRDERRWLEELARFRSPQESWPLAREWALALLGEDRAPSALEFLARCEPAAHSHAADREEWELARCAAALRLGDLALAREHLDALGDDPSELARLARASLLLREGRSDAVLELLDPRTLAELSAAGRERAAVLVGEAALARGDLALARRELELAFESAVASDQSLRERRVEALSGSVIGERLGLHAVVLLAETLALDGEPLAAVARIEDAHARSLRADSRVSIDEHAVRAWAAHAELGLLTWIIGADRSLAAHVAPDGSAAFERIDLPRARVLEAVRRVREAALDPRASTPRFDALALELATALLPGELGPRLARLRASGTTAPRLIVLAHGPLEAAPLEALPWPALGDDVAFAVLPGLSEARPGALALGALAAPWNLLGAPLETSERPPLKGAHEELTELAALHADATLVTHAHFTRASVLEACRSSSPLHIATHLDAVCEPWRAFGASGLRTSDPRELCADDLARASPRLPLVVLSTCASGSGARVDAEGQLGLARAFLAGGTRNVVVTLWPIEDRAAPRAALRLHEELSAGASPARAAARTRAWLKALGAGVAEWAAVRLVGRD
ncbi:MAG: CHAT domain-containing protein, partial [Planctomycetes bacterium]|nr:CHAT domain-containing protein [Planctomycetota bacterium]